MATQAFTPELGEHLFSAQPFRFQLGLRRGEPSWFRLHGWDADALAERRRVLATAPERALPWSSAAEALWPELGRLFQDGELEPATATPRHLGERWEPDWLLLARTADGDFRFVGGCVCFPSGWAPEEKLGRSVAEIHDAVPTLNRDLGERIRMFLARLDGDALFERENWGLAALPDRGLHPAADWPRPTAGTPLDRLWLRVEFQAFRGLPTAGGLLFLIHVRVWPLGEVIAHGATRTALRAQLAAMPDAIAAYKGLAAVRPALLRALA
jgi:dimethylamine monooxygenase subunit A